MASIETDYLIIGAGAVGLAFADTLLEETDADMVIVDRRGKPGGHWNDAYSFVALHQPSAYYGVNSTPLGSDRKDSWGVNKGLYELASGAEVSAYFDRVMHQRLLASGRVHYLPMSDWRDRAGVVSLLSGQTTEVKVRRKVVDATWFGTTIPATHTPQFSIGAGVRCVPPNALPQLWQKPGALPHRYVIIGAGKTAMDAVGWLLGSGAPADAISWVMPRDSWLLNRLKTQPGLEFFEETMGGQLALMEAYASATSVDDLFVRLEQAGVVMRIYPERTPTMFHYATISTGEVEVLRAVTDVIRLGRVVSISASGIELEQGSVSVDAATTL